MLIFLLCSYSSVNLLLYIFFLNYLILNIYVLLTTKMSFFISASLLLETLLYRTKVLQIRRAMWKNVMTKFSKNTWLLPHFFNVHALVFAVCNFHVVLWIFASSLSTLSRYQHFSFMQQLILYSIDQLLVRTVSFITSPYQNTIFSSLLFNC